LIKVILQRAICVAPIFHTENQLFQENQPTKHKFILKILSAGPLKPVISAN